MHHGCDGGGKTVCISSRSQFIDAALLRYRLTTLLVRALHSRRANGRTNNTKMCVKLNFNCLFTPDLMTGFLVSGAECCAGKTSTEIMLSHNYVSCRRLSSSHTPKLLSFGARVWVHLCFIYYRSYLCDFVTVLLVGSGRKLKELIPQTKNSTKNDIIFNFGWSRDERPHRCPIQSVRYFRNSQDLHPSRAMWNIRAHTLWRINRPSCRGMKNKTCFVPIKLNRSSNNIPDPDPKKAIKACIEREKRANVAKCTVKSELTWCCLA